MEFGAHLPLFSRTGKGFSLENLLSYTEAAERLGFQSLCMTDHLLFPRPWLDGPTALAAVLSRTGQMTLVTSVALPVVRGPVPLAKTLAAIDVLSGGRLIVGVGPGSSAEDYAAVGIPFEERWERFDEAVQFLNALLRRGEPPFKGVFYSSEGIKLEPYPDQLPGPPLWIGSWSSPAGLRRTARLGDGWMGSALHTTPDQFGEAWNRLREYLYQAGKDPNTFPNALSTMPLYITEDQTSAEQMAGLLTTRTHSGSELIGSAEKCAEKLAAYRAAGVQRVFLNPMDDHVRQLETFQERVAPLLRE